MKLIQGLQKYYITEKGYVFSEYSNKFLKFGCRKGYKYVRLKIGDKKYKNFSIHLLVLENYIEPRPGDNYVANHKDLNKLNNDKDNLEWVTIEENTEHAMRGGAIISYGVSKFRGVSFEQNKWRVRVRKKGKRISVGCYGTEIEAAKAYNKFIIENNLNRPLNDIEDKRKNG